MKDLWYILVLLTSIILVFLVRNGHLNPPHMTAFLLYFEEIIALLVVETKWCYRGHLEGSDDRPSPFSDVTEAEMLCFLR